MTRHERTIIAAEELPSIDATKSTAQSRREIDPRHDVALIATRGHVLMARLDYLFGKLWFPSLWCWLAMLVVCFLMFNGALGFFGPNFQNNRVMWSITEALTYDPDTYFDIGGGLKGGPDVAWLGRYAPTPESLKPADYSALVEAVKADSAKFGIEAANYEAVGGLKIAPTLVSAEKFEKNADSLKNGVVVIPKDDEKIIVAAYVEAKWAFTVVLRGRCVALVGPVPTGCADNTSNDGSLDGQSVTFLSSLKAKE
ncbi:hypothetical protein [Agrobacterium tumefaciens]|uniref:hypothetical protein n=1 Tax=Agrobacterium tumefaciens TaxID=358 RepID=UPI001571BEE2|nr:hypothetical protein [Agrobacterium tumefaciens]